MRKNLNKQSGLNDLGDLKLAAKAASGGERARREIANLLYDKIRTTVRYLSADHRDQEDWVQLALVEILRSCGTFNGKSSLFTWANKITWRVTMRQLKMLKGREKVVSLTNSLPEFRKQTNDEEKRIFVRKRLAVLLGSISPERRTVLVMHLVYGYTISEVAEFTSAPYDTVRSRLRKGRRLLKKKIAKDPIFGKWLESREI